MNEGIAVFLHNEDMSLLASERFIRRIDKLLLKFGIEYTGFRNLYRPIETVDRDSAVFAACKALENTDWLKERLAYVSIMNHTNACQLEQIRTDGMAEPSPEKLEYYEAYYQATHRLAHGIVVDEDKKLRDGYISYLIARKHEAHPDILEAYADSPLKKVVMGQHVLEDNGKWKRKNGKWYLWTYSLKEAVVPGDILKVQTKKGPMYMCVDRIDYVTGEGFCGQHSAVIEHMKKRIDTQE